MGGNLYNLKEIPYSVQTEQKSFGYTYPLFKRWDHAKQFTLKYNFIYILHNANAIIIGKGFLVIFIFIYMLFLNIFNPGFVNTQ